MTTARDELDQIRQRAEDATDGPWFGSMGESVVFGRIPGDEVAQCARRADARFVQASRTDVPCLVAALTAALDLCDDPGGPDSWSHMFQGRQSVFVDDISAVITAALTPKETDS